VQENFARTVVKIRFTFDRFIIIFSLKIKFLIFRFVFLELACLKKKTKVCSKHRLVAVHWKSLRVSCRCIARSLPHGDKRLSARTFFLNILYFMHTNAVWRSLYACATKNFCAPLTFIENVASLLYSFPFLFQARCFHVLFSRDLRTRPAYVEVNVTSTRDDDKHNKNLHICSSQTPAQCPLWHSHWHNVFKRNALKSVTKLPCFSSFRKVLWIINKNLQRSFCLEQQRSNTTRQAAYCEAFDLRLPRRSDCA